MKIVFLWVAFLMFFPSIGVGCAAAGVRTGDGDDNTDGAGDADADTDSDADGDADTEYDGPAIPPTCADAAVALTSVGCVFFTADLDNWDQCDSKIYAVVVSNPHDDQEAHVILENGTQGQIGGVTLAPGELHVFDVTCDDGCLQPPHQIEVQGIGPAAGFRVSSDVPILGYQWNPYGAQLFSTDASLLIPVTSLDGTYIVAAWGSGPGSDWPQLTSQVTVVVTEDDTTLTFTPSTTVPQKGGVGPLGAGMESAPFTLNAFDVISISPLLHDADLTGTVVQADKPVVVFGGHSCANVPTGEYAACDHVEEQMLPLAAWGTSTVLARHAPRAGCQADDDPVLWRIIAGVGNMRVTFDPPAPAPAGAEHHFSDQGDLLEFLSATDHSVEGFLDNPPDPAEPEAPFLAYQMMTGTSYPQCGWGGADPMMLQSPPAGQFLDRYVFTTDNVFDFAYDHIIVVRKAGTEVTLDCMGVLPDTSFAQVGSSEWQVARVFIDNPQDSTGCADGAHLLTATAGVGLSVVGNANANSYGYLGGVGVWAINPQPVVE